MVQIARLRPITAISTLGFLVVLFTQLSWRGRTSLSNGRACRPQSLRTEMAIELDAENIPETSIYALNLASGGRFKPVDCSPEQNVAIIIPFRDREEHLKILLHHLHPFLQRQRIQYQIFVVEQVDQHPFNRALLFNIGYLESLRVDHFDCFIFHDVDLLPEDERIQYSCQARPWHMSTAIDYFGYTLQYPEYVGGVLALRFEHMKIVNGFSNLYWGWGAEDDDMWERMMAKGLNYTSVPEEIGRYTMIKHDGRVENENRRRFLNRAVQRMEFDGLTNAVEFSRVLSRSSSLLCFRIKASLGLRVSGKGQMKFPAAMNIPVQR